MVYFRQIGNLSADVSYTPPPFDGIASDVVPGVTLPAGATRIGTNHFIIIVDATVEDTVISLPESNASAEEFIGIQYTIIKIDDSVNTVSVVAGNTDKIDSYETPVVIANKNDRISLISIGGPIGDGNWLSM